MEKEEIIVLANKVRAGKASPEEIEELLNELQARVADLNEYLSTLPKKV